MKREVRVFYIFIAMLALLAPMASAQSYKYDAGASLGMTGYLGDVNNGNLWKHPGFTVGGIFRYIHNGRWAFKGTLNLATISGDSRDIDNKFFYGNQYKFNSLLTDLSASAEFNFFNFGAGARYKKYKRWTPYLTLGVGVVVATCDKDVAASFVIPMGFGFKYKLKERLNIGFEFTMRKEFSDKIDNFSDLLGVKHGFGKNTDWYSFAMFTITYEFSKRCVRCHYVE